MNINKSSWHYRAIKVHARMFETNMPSSLCPYMRRLMLWIPTTFAVSLFLVELLLFALVACPLMAIYGSLIDGISIFPLDTDNPIGFFTLISMILYSLAAFIGACILIGDWWRYEGGRTKASKVAHCVGAKLPSPTQSSTVQLVIDYWDAVHNKFCPKLEYVEDGPK